MCPQTEKWITIQEYCEDTYREQKSIVKEKIAQGIWKENKHWKIGKDGEIFINYEAVLWLAINNLP